MKQRGLFKSIFRWFRDETAETASARMLEPVGQRAIAPPIANQSVNPAQVYVSGLAKGSRRTMRQSLATIAELATAADIVDPYQFPWHLMRFAHTAAIRAQLAEVYAPSTANKMLSALRGTLKAAWQLGMMSAEDYHAAASVKAISGETLPAGRAVTADELNALIMVCQADPSAAGARDAAIFAILYICGLRRAELVALDLDDYSPTSASLRVHGKRNKQRIVYLAAAEGYLKDWLALRGDEGEAIFIHVIEGLAIAIRLSESGIYKMIVRRAAAAGVEHLSPHDLRRTFVGDLLDAGVDIVTAQKMAGHADIKTTARYDRRPEDTKKRAAGLLRLPGRKKQA